MSKVLDYIENLRQKPESHRRRMQFLISTGVALVVLIVWGITFTTTGTKQDVTAQNGDTILSPLGVLRNELKATVEEVKAGLIILKGDKK